MVPHYQKKKTIMLALFNCRELKEVIPKRKP